MVVGSLVFRTTKFIGESSFISSKSKHGGIKSLTFLEAQREAPKSQKKREK